MKTVRLRHLAFGRRDEALTPHGMRASVTARFSSELQDKIPNLFASPQPNFPMTLSYFRPLVLTLCFCLLIGCSALLETGSRQAPEASFARRSTFRFLPDISAPISTSNYWRGEIGRALLSALNAKGYRFFPNRQTDFLVAYHIVLADHEVLAALDPDLAPGQAGIVDISKLQDRQHPGEAGKGAIVIDLIDSKQKKLLWRGWARTKFEQVQAGPAMERLAKLAVDRILEKLPGRI
jgi:Domain of unknown function (DUF4136)